MTGPDLPASPGNTPPFTHDVTRFLTAWLPQQRWFGGSTGQPVTLQERHRLPGPTPAELLIVSDSTASYLVPMSWYAEPQHQLDHALIGAADDWCGYDGLHDPAVVDRLYQALADGSSWGPVNSHRVGTLPQGLTGISPEIEQSNTSVIFGDQIMIKFFRQLNPGINPDAEITERLADCAHTADPAGELRIEMSGAQTTIALGTHYVRNCVDGWSTAAASVRDLLAGADRAAGEVGGDFAPESERLGSAVAAVHNALAETFGVETANGEAIIARVAAGSVTTCESIPELAALQRRITATFDRLRETMADVVIPLQRIHGDLHLGQTLRTVERWLVIDFEGEPSRSPAERRSMMPAARDIAGMLRSFDYAAHHPLQFGYQDQQRTWQATDWAARNQRAFLAGYAAIRPLDHIHPPLLEAFELGKAIYEVGYEARHRPEWQSIPLTAVRRLISADTDGRADMA